LLTKCNPIHVDCLHFDPYRINSVSTRPMSNR